MRAVALKRPADNVGVVKIVVLTAIEPVPAHSQHDVEHGAARRLAVGGDAVVISVENTGVTLRPEQDNRVGNRLEPGRDHALQRLPVLCVVILDKGHGAARITLHKRAVQKRAHVEVSAAAAGFEKMEVQRHVEQRHAPAAGGEIGRQLRQAGRPVFPDREELAACVGAQRGKPLPEKCETDVFDSIQTETVDVCRVQVPLAPAGQLGCDRRVGEAEVGTHQIVVVAVFRRDLAVPGSAGKVIDRVALSALVPVHTVKMSVIPGEIRIFTVTAGECEARPGLDGFLAGDGLFTVGRGILDSLDGLDAVGPHLVIENDIGVNLQTGLLQGADGREIFRARAVLRGDGALLVEFAEVVEIVGPVAHVVFPGLALVRGRQPHGAHADRAQVRRVSLRPPPETAVRGEVPLEILHHHAVCHPEASAVPVLFIIAQRRDMRAH